MLRNKFISLMGTLAVLGGCAAPPDSTAPVTKPFSAAAEAPAGHATLYVYRPENRIKRMVSYDIFLSETKVTTLSDSTYTVVYAKPGRYIVRTDTPWFSKSLTESSNIQGAFVIPATGTYFLKFDRSYGPAIPGHPYTINYERWSLLTAENALPEIRATTFAAAQVMQLAP